MGKDEAKGTGTSTGNDFQGGGKVDNYAVVPSPNPGQYRVADVSTGKDVTGDHDKATAQEIADKYQSEPNPMRHDHNNYGAGSGGSTGTGGGTDYASDPSYNGGSTSGYSPVD